ncbi:MAG: hypothetical protein ACFKPT_26330 [Gloeotrichia echinulata GP01]
MQEISYNHAETLFNLGITYQYAGIFDSAYTTYKSTIETVELLRGSIISGEDSGEESKRKQAEQFNEDRDLIIISVSSWGRYWIAKRQPGVQLNW